MGVDSLAMGLVGGATGLMLERGLAGLDIPTDLVRIAGETRTNVVVTDVRAGQHIKVNEAGPTVEPQELRALVDRVRERARTGDIWILSGSLPPGVPPDTYGQLVSLVQAAGAKAYLDTSGEPLRLGCEARPFLVKPNVIEGEELTGQAINSEDDALRAAESVLERGVNTVALSLGAGGLLLASGQGAVLAIPPQVEVRNTVGAGDALMAGVTWALEQERSLRDVARWGVAAGTAAAVSEGVSAGSFAEVQALYQGILAKDGPSAAALPT
jgi:1-phosphofructokinase family hexose kinase